MADVVFWTKDSGNLMPHGSGLTEEQIKMLQDLKPGDRLILLKNNKKVTDRDYAVKLMKYKKAETTT